MRTYGRIRLEDGEWLLEVEPHVSMRFKDIFRKASKADAGVISIADSESVRKDLDWFLSRYPLEMSEEDRARITDGAASFDRRTEDIEKLFVPQARHEDYAMTKQPRDYQKVAIEVMHRAGSLLCADDVGLGKTIVGIGGIVRAGEYPAMVVCQTHLPQQWVEKFAEFAPQVRCHIIKTRRAYSLPEADVYIMPYSRLIGWDAVIDKGTFKTVVYDEIQELRRSDSSKYSTARALTEKANRVLGLSATPIYNFGSEMHSVMNVIRPGALGTWYEFLREWCVANYYDSSKARVKDPKALGTFLRENHMMLRRTRKDVARELPPVNKIVHQVEYDEDTAEKAQTELSQIAARVLTGSFTERGQAARELDARARMLTGVAKARSVAEYVKILLENGEKVLLVGWHREVYETWNQELSEYRPVMYTGSESPNQKEEARKAFMRTPFSPTDGYGAGGHPATNLLIMSLRSGVGLDGLQEVCSIVVFGELDWSPGVHEQVVGRLQRDGQGNTVMAIYLVTDNGTDPLMIDMLGLKASQAHGIVNPNSEIEFAESDDTRIRQLAEAILARRKS